MASEIFHNIASGNSSMAEGKQPLDEQFCRIINMRNFLGTNNCCEYERNIQNCSHNFDIPTSQGKDTWPRFADEHIFVVHWRRIYPYDRVMRQASVWMIDKPPANMSGNIWQANVSEWNRVRRTVSNFCPLKLVLLVFIIFHCTFRKREKYV